MTTRQANFKRSIDGIFTVFANLKNQKTGEVDKPLKSALFNVGVLIILAAFIGVFLVLGPFLKPLLWSFLFGAVLFPAKKRLSNAINNWINVIETHDSPVALGIVLFPFHGLVKLGEIITLWIIAHIKVLSIGLGSVIFVQLVLIYVPAELYSAIAKLLMWNHILFGKIVGILNMKLILMTAVTFIISVFVLWSTSSSSSFTILGQTLWILVVAYLSSFFGSLQIPVFFCCIIYGLVGIAYDDRSVQDGNVIFGKLRRIITKEGPIEKGKNDIEEDHPIGLLLKTKTQFTKIKQKMQLNLHSEVHDPTMDKGKERLLESGAHQSSVFFKALFYACSATILWNQMWIMFLCFIPMSFFGVKELFRILGLWNYILEQWTNKYSKILENWLEPRRSALLPIWLPAISRINSKVHKFVCQKMKSFVDDISATLMILFLVCFVTFLAVFFFVQIYSENLAVANLSANLINRTLTLKPELVEMLPINMQSMNDFIDNAYKYSRGTIEDYIDNVFNQTNPEQAKKLKLQILAVWDRLIQSYMDRNNDGIGPRVPSQSVLSSLDEIVTTSGVTFRGLFAWGQSNLGMLISSELSDSIWIVLKANVSLLFSTITTLFSVVLGGGHAMIKFLFNTIIFFTTLYYLLQSSQDRYAPIAMNINSAWGSRLTDALEDSVSSVLIATLKLSLFHGLFFWLTHTLFGAHIVYLPSILASVLAAAPFLETYWCSFPAFLDLWLSQDRFYLGLTLVLIHFIVPPYCTSIVHSEIKGGGHPYLTALSIVGGMYLFGGIEGAILGPLLLCLLVVLCTVTVNSLNSPQSTLTHQSSIEESNSIASPATDWDKTNESTI